MNSIEFILKGGFDPPPQPPAPLNGFKPEQEASPEGDTTDVTTQGGSSLTAWRGFSKEKEIFLIILSTKKSYLATLSVVIPFRLFDNLLIKPYSGLDRQQWEHGEGGCGFKSRIIILWSSIREIDFWDIIFMKSRHCSISSHSEKNPVHVKKQNRALVKSH